jgi:hypothetical protein
MDPAMDPLDTGGKPTGTAVVARHGRNLDAVNPGDFMPVVLIAPAVFQHIAGVWTGEGKHGQKEHTHRIKCYPPYPIGMRICPAWASNFDAGGQHCDKFHAGNGVLLSP